MRLTLVLVFATLGIVATHRLFENFLVDVAKTKPKSDPLLVKAHVAGEIKSGSTGWPGKSCWKKCGGKSGPCKVCSGGKYCCKKGVAENGCNGKQGSKEGKCVKPVTPPGMRVRTRPRCEEKAKYKEVGGTVFNYCPEKGSDKETSGNYVIAAFDKKILDINYVEAYKCDPKPDDCNCKSLLTGVVQKFPRASKISLIFTATPAIAGCKCYLGTAARNGFKKVDVENCDAIIDFDEKNYSKKCEDLIGRADQCYVGKWYIKK